jgi:RsiW-degrading membrane proteinase PrsW (M82 family)
LTTFDPNLLLPPREEEEVYPYRRIWRSLAIESAVVLTVASVTYLIFQVFGLQLPHAWRTPVNLGLALIPVGVWLALSWWAERFVQRPRQRLLSVMIISALAANAVGIPLINDLFQVDRWLPLSNAIMRIIGYTFTVGIVQEMLKYLVLRYTVWPDDFRIRLDGVAYGAASAVGYASALNLHYVLSIPSTPDVAANRIFGNLALHLVTSALVGYGLSEVRFSQPSPFFLTVTLALAAFVTGAAIPIRAGLVNTGLSIDVSSSNPLLNLSLAKPLYGLAFSLVLLIALSVVLSFLFTSSEQREREAAVQEI